MKRCEKCGREKPLDDFHRRNSIPSGRQPHCKECVREYAREWRKRNKPRLRAQGKRYRDAHKAETAERVRRWYEANKERALETSRRWRDENRERHDENLRRWHVENRERRLRETREREAADPELKRERYRQWYEANKTRNYERVLRYRTRKRDAFVEDVPRETIYERDEGICQICGDPVLDSDYEIDHIVPLAEGGLHEAQNLQLAHPSCNRRKGAKLTAA